MQCFFKNPLMESCASFAFSTDAVANESDRLSSRTMLRFIVFKIRSRKPVLPSVESAVSLRMSLMNSRLRCQSFRVVVDRLVLVRSCSAAVAFQTKESCSWQENGGRKISLIVIFLPLSSCQNRSANSLSTNLERLWARTSTKRKQSPVWYQFANGLIEQIPCGSARHVL